MIAADTPLKGLKLAVVDTETTGLDPMTSRIVDIAVVHIELGGGAPEVEFSSFVNPREPIPADASRIHGITDEMVKDAPTWPDIQGALLDACEDRVIVAYNAPFDFGMVMGEARRHPDPDAPPWAPRWPWLDLFVVRKAASRFGKKKLAEVAAEHGIALDAHGAAGDALVAALLATPLLRALWREGGFSGTTIGALLAWQREAALAQERDFAAWAKRQNWATPPNCPWHELEAEPPPTWDVPVKTRITKGGRTS